MTGLGDFVDKGVRNSCSWNFPKNRCKIGIYKGILSGFCTEVVGWASMPCRIQIGCKEPAKQEIKGTDSSVNEV
jgi:hypothetical protein